MNPTLPVRVFKNLQRGCYTIMQAGRVQASARQIHLAEVEFRVRAAGRERMLREGRKNVHAFAIGLLVDHVHPDDPRELVAFAGRRVHYDPYRFASFVDSETHAPVSAARLVRFDSGEVRYADDTDAERAPPLPRAA